MTRLFPPSQIPHPWRQTLAILAISVWLTLAGYWLIVGPLFWLVKLFGPIDWDWTGPGQA